MERERARETASAEPADGGPIQIRLFLASCKDKASLW